VLRPSTVLAEVFPGAPEGFDAGEGLDVFVPFEARGELRSPVDDTGGGGGEDLDEELKRIRIHQPGLRLLVRGIVRAGGFVAGFGV
jgi:hypothetical protein